MCHLAIAGLSNMRSIHFGETLVPPVYQTKSSDDEDFDSRWKSRRQGCAQAQIPQIRPMVGIGRRSRVVLPL